MIQDDEENNNDKSNNTDSEMQKYKNMTNSMMPNIPSSIPNISLPKF